MGTLRFVMFIAALMLYMPSFVYGSGQYDGEWVIDDSGGKLTGTVTLEQQGNSLKGVGHLKKGTLKVEGFVTGQNMQLLFIHNDIIGLTHFVPEKTAQQILGITAKLIIPLGGDPNRLEGTYYGWQIHWDQNLNMTQRFEGGTPEANRENPPRKLSLVRKTVAPQPVNISWVDLIHSGKPFHVSFDVAPSKFNDEGWQGPNQDPMGTLKGGENYLIVYNSSIQEWKVSGFNEGTGGVGTWMYKGGTPESCQLNLWGRLFMYTKEGKIIDLDYGWVGHLQE